MKKLFYFFPLFLIAVMGMAVTACGDDDKMISENELPAASKSFVSTYFPTARVVTVEKDRNEYEIILSDGTKIDFNKSGEWTDVDAPMGKVVPTGFYPAPIDTYVSTNFTGIGINEISKDRRGYDVELVNGIDLLFNEQGNFISYDMD